MATYYIDPDNGNDANAGTSFALAWKTVILGATAARIAAGDVIRIKASPLPTLVGSATWTNASPTVTLASAVTANIDMGETAWTSDHANVTCTADATDYKEGSNSAKFAVGAAFTTGLMAHKALAGATDFSAYSQVSFWIKVNAASLAAGALELRLCSDTAGTVVVDTITIPALAGTSFWHAFTVARSGGGTLGASIQSIALYANSDPGTVNVNLDCIIACKASSSADSLSLTSLIGKNTSDGWYPIASIDGVTVKLDSNTQALPAARRGYTGTSESVNTYKREAFLLAPVGSTSTAQNEAMDAGSGGNYIHFSGGWNRTDMSTQETGENAYSWFSGQNGLGVGWKADAPRHAIKTENIGLFRFYSGFSSSSSPTAHQWIHLMAVACSTTGFASSAKGLYASDIRAYNNGGDGVSFNSLGGGVLETVVSNNNNSTSGINFTSSSAIGRNFTSKNNVSYGVAFAGCSVTIDGLTTANNGSYGAYGAGGYDNYVNNWSASEANEVLVSTTVTSRWSVYSTKHDGTADNHIQFFDGGRVSSETGADRRTASGIAWKLSPTSAYRDSVFPVATKIAAIAVTSGTLVTVKVWCKRDNTGITGRLFVRGGQLGGPTNDTSASTAGAAGSYEQLTVTWTPSESGVVEIEGHAYGGTTYNAWMDDMEISQA